MQIKYILLDWDGCMANTLEVWMRTYLTLYKEAGIAVTPEDVVSHSWGNLSAGPKYFGIPDYEAFWKKIIAGVKAGVATVSLYPGVKETVLNLKTLGIPMAVVTSSERQLVEPALKFHGLDKIIDYVITEEEVTRPKPDPEMLNLALKKLDGESKSSLIVGDSAKDIIAGKNGNIRTALVLHPENKRFYDFSKLKSLSPDYTLSSFPELLSVVKNI